MGAPHYGTFGNPAHLPATPAHRLTRPYVGGYLEPAGTHGGCETGPYNPSQQCGHAEQNQNPAAIEAAQSENVE